MTNWKEKQANNVPQVAHVANQFNKHWIDHMKDNRSVARISNVRMHCLLYLAYGFHIAATKKAPILRPNACR